MNKNIYEIIENRFSYFILLILFIYQNYLLKCFENAF